MSHARGNALFIILIAVALFTALSYAITQSGRGGGSTEKERVDLIAAEILQDAAAVLTAIDRVKLVNGCQETEISFDSPHAPVGAYTNPNSPLDKSCHVFEPEGGNIPWQTYPASIGDSGETAYAYATGSGHPIGGFGNALLGDLYMVLPQVSTSATFSEFMDVCRALNRRVGVPLYPGDYEELPGFYHGAFDMYFKGTYGDSPIPTGSGYLAQFPAFCVYFWAGTVRIAMPLILR